VQGILQELQISHSKNARLWCDNMGAKYLTQRIRGSCDNMGAKYLTSHHIFHRRMKHIKVDYHFVRDCVTKKLLDVRFILTDDQVANGFMKALPHRRLLEFQHNLNLIKL
jgi:hypothetical protein